MKKNILISTFFLFCSSILLAQTTDKDEANNSKIDFVVIPKMGFGRIFQSNQPSLNGFVNGGDILVSFKLNKSSFISTGIGYTEFNANQTIFGKAASLKNTYLHFPVNYTSNYTFFKSKTDSDKVLLSIGIGLYGNNLFKQEVETVDGNFSEKNVGWNIGFSTYLGIKFNVSDMMNIGVGMETNNDWTKIKKDGESQKMDNLTTLNLTLGYRIK